MDMKITKKDTNTGSKEKINNFMEKQTVSRKDIIAIASKLGSLAEDLKERLMKYGGNCRVT